MSRVPTEDELFEAYRRTKYEAETPQGTIVLRHAQPTPALDQLLNSTTPVWAFITAWNPGSRELPREANIDRGRALQEELSKRYRCYRGVGIGKKEAWPPEESLLVLGIDLDEAQAIGARYGQLAILAGRRGEPAHVVDCRRPACPKRG